MNNVPFPGTELVFEKIQNLACSGGDFFLPTGIRTPIAQQLYDELVAINENPDLTDPNLNMKEFATLENWSPQYDWASWASVDIQMVPDQIVVSAHLDLTPDKTYVHAANVPDRPILNGLCLY